jgi:D-sedoheptulose 7-phosphate isomerase
MKPIREHLAEAARLLAAVADGPLGGRVDEAAERIATALSARLPLLVCGNGGSAADAEHITGELVGRFLKERRALKCVCLSSSTATLTAWANDYDYETVFARQVEAYGERGGVLLGLSTSGNSANVVTAFAAARRLGMTTVAMTGEGGGRLRELSDVLIDVPSRRTPDIQQVHVVLYHYLCEAVEARCAAAE